MSLVFLSEVILKRVCAVLVCVVFCLPLLLIPAFAVNVLETDSSSLRSSDSSFQVRFSASSSYFIGSLVVDGVTLCDYSYDDGVKSFDISLSLNSVHSLSGTLWVRSTASRPIDAYYSDGSGFHLISSVLSSPSVLLYDDPVVISLSYVLHDSEFYFSVPPRDSVPFTITAPGAFPSDAYIMSGLLNGVEVFSFTSEDAVRSVTLYLMPGASYSFVGTFYSQGVYYMQLTSGGGNWFSTNISNPTRLSYSDSFSCIFIGYSYSLTNYFTVESPPFTNVIGSGVGVVISSFGDVIEYVVNTPAVALFVGLSVSCALIPLGIIAVKKVIKGY